MLYFKKSNLWIPPVLGASIAILLATGTLYLDHQIAWESPAVPFYKGNLDSANSLLSVIATSVTTLLALIFTIIVVAIQLASSQYSPRALATLLQDGPSRFTIGVFVGTFTYTLMVLWGLRFTDTENGDYVSGLSLTLAFLFAIFSLGNFAVYSNHIIHSVRVTSLINRLGSETRKAIEQLYRPNPTYSIEKNIFPKKAPDHVIYSQKVGAIVEMKLDKLVDLARKTNATVEVAPVIGMFIPEGAPLLKIYGEKPEKLLDYIKIIGERSMEKDILFGFRQLSDISIRANSPGINDPASSVQVIDQLHDLLKRLIKIEMGDLVAKDSEGKARLLIRLPTWEDVLHVAVDETRLYGAGSLQVVRRLRAMLDDLLRDAPDHRAPSIKQQMELLDEVVRENFKNDYLREAALQPDVRGTAF